MATITLTPTSLSPGSSVRVVGTGFPHNHGVTVSLDGVGRASGKTSSTGAFTVIFVVPATTSAGSHTVAAQARTTKATATLSVVAPTPTPTPTPTPSVGPVIPSGATVLFLDTFASSGLDLTKWRHPSDFHCCGTPIASGGFVAGYDGPVRVPGDGHAYLDAVRDAVTASHWHVPIINTIERFSRSQGPNGIHIEVRGKMPVGNGLWPAVGWLYGSSGIDEIDVNETLANPTAPSTNATYDSRYDRVHVHSSANASAFEDHVMLPSGASLGDDFHAFGVDWAADHVTFYLDGVKTPKSPFTNAAQIPPGPLALIVNLGVSNGNDWGGDKPADSSTPSPSTLVLDWVAAWTL